MAAKGSGSRVRPRSGPVPPQYRPNVWELPRVAWVVGRAYMPRHGGVPLALMAMPVFFAVVGTAAARNGLAASPERDVALSVLATGPGRLRRAGRAALGGIAGMAAGYTMWLIPVYAVLVLVASLVPWSLTETPWLWSTLTSLPLFAPSAAGLLVFRSPRDLRSGTALIRAYRADPSHPYVLANFAAYPTGQGKGFKFASRLLADPLIRGTFLLAARNDDARRLYESLGFTEHPAEPSVHTLTLP